MSTAVDFNLRDVVLAEMADNPSPDPYVVAAAVVDRLDDCDLRAALAAVLPLFVRGVVSPAGRPHREAASEARRAGRNRARGWLATSAPGADGVYKFLGDFEVADCLAAAGERRRHAELNARAADWYERVAKLLRKHRVAVIGDLPDVVLDGLR